jgi:protein-L-isoaspartate(D-aspartate) O-methyltransferase
VSRRLSNQLLERGIRDRRVLEAVAQVPRRLFVPEGAQHEAEADHPLPIGWGQTISQPYIVGAMTAAAELRGEERVLEVGTGSGYQTAILALLAGEVFSIEIIPDLAAQARRVLLETLGLRNVRLRVGDGRAGWPEAAPFDAILVTAAPAEIPPALLEQMAPGGRLVIPVGEDAESQRLLLVRRGEDGLTTTTDLMGVRFVPLTGQR